MNIKINKTLLILISLILAIIILVEGLYLIALPRYLNGLFSSHKIESVLKEKTGLILTYKDARIKTTPSFNLVLNFTNLLLKDSDDNKILSAKEYNSAIRVVPLLFKKVVLKQMSANDLYFNFSRNKDKKLYLGNYPLNLDFEAFKGREIEFDNLTVGNVNILFEDKFLNQKISAKIPQAQISYKDKDDLKGFIKADIYINNRSAKHKVSAIDLNFVGDKFKCDGFIKNVDLSDYSPYLGYFSNKDVKSVSGKIDADFSSDKDLSVSASLKDFSVIMKNPLDSITSDSDIFLNSALSFDDKTLYLKKFKLNAKNWEIDVDGKIEGYKDKKQKLDLSVVIPKSDIHSFYHVIPSIDGDPQDSIQKFKKYGAWGDLEGKLNIKGGSDNPEVYGDVLLSNVYIVKFNPAVPKCKIDVKFLKNKVKVTTRVFSGKNEYVDVDGIAEMKPHGAGDFHITSSSKVDLATVQYMLIPIHDVVGFDLGPVPYMGLKGTGNIDIFTKGSVIEGEVSGAFNFNNATASLNGLNTVIDKANGKLIFKRKDILFYTTRAFIKNQPFKIDGKADLSGNIDFDVTSASIDMADLFNILITSPMLNSKKTMVEPIDKISGKVDTKIKVKGQVKDFEELLSNQLLQISGTLLLKDNSVKLKLSPLWINKLNGKIEFDDKNWKTDIAGFIGSSKVNIKGSSQDGKVNLKANGDALKTDELIDILVKAQNNKYPRLPKTNSLITFSGEYKSNTSDFDINKVKAHGQFKPMSNEKDQNFIVYSGFFNLSNGDLSLKNFNAKLFDSIILAQGKVSKAFSKNPSTDGVLNVSDFDLSNFNSLKKTNLLPQYAKKLLNAYEDYQGRANVSVMCKNNKLRGTIELKDIKFNHSYFKTPIVVDSGNILLDGEKITLKSMIAKVDNTPVFINASVWDLDKTIRFSGYFTTKLTEYFANKYINNNLTYPVKPKGDITVTSDIDGNIDNFRIRPKIRFAPDADLYYMGANLGDESEEREVNADISVLNNTYFIRKVDYVRFMISQNDKAYPLRVLTANGVIQGEGKKFFIRNLNIETLNNANVKMFNVIFKKSVLKNGMFNCRLNLKGDINNPYIRGDVYMDNLDMPLYDTIVKNIGIQFKDKIIDIKAKGVIFDSDFTLSAVMRNKFKPPYELENITINSEKLNLDKMFNSLTQVPTPNTAMKMGETAKVPFNISDVLVKKGSMSANEMIIRGLETKNYIAEFKLDEDMVLVVDKLGFDVTTGKMVGTASYNFSNGRIKAVLSAYNVDSNKVASTLFDFKDQIFGQANGNLVLTTKGSSEQERIKNLFGSVYFDITDGKMPKLGSVEYLLKAGNALKSGITGASISNLIDLIAPIKTGYFDSIKGKLSLKNGVAQDIEVYSKGDNLNMYISGEYDILQQYANMRVYGRLTKKATNILGSVGNLSFNSILNAIPGIRLEKEDKLKIVQDINKIPGVELSDKQYRVFTVKIDGKMNEEKYVKSFRWIE